MTGTHSVEITGNGVVLNGEKIENVRAVQYTHVAGEPPLLKLEVWSFDGAVASEAIVETTVMEARPGKSAVIDFLTSIDPSQLDAETLGRMDWSHKTNGELVLEVLTDWANGEDSS